MQIRQIRPAPRIARGGVEDAAAARALAAAALGGNPVPPHILQFNREYDPEPMGYSKPETPVPMETSLDRENENYESPRYVDPPAPHNVRSDFENEVENQMRILEAQMQEEMARESQVPEVKVKSALPASGEEAAAAVTVVPSTISAPATEQNPISGTADALAVEDEEYANLMREKAALDDALAEVRATTPQLFTSSLLSLLICS